MSAHPTLIIRAAALDDAAALVELTGQLGYPTTVQQMDVRLRVLLADQHQGVLVASVQGRVIGWAAIEQRLTLVSGTRTELVGLVVDGQQRSSGIGARLLHAAEQWALVRGATHLTLRTNVIRTRAHVFYETHGYVRGKSQHMYARTLKASPS